MVLEEDLTTATIEQLVFKEFHRSRYMACAKHGFFTLFFNGCHSCYGTSPLVFVFMTKIGLLCGNT